MNVTIRGKRWTLVFTEDLPTDVDGLCDQPTTKGKQIRIRASLQGERRLEVILHELEHAADWDKDEEAVCEIARERAKILTRLGYKET